MQVVDRVEREVEHDYVVHVRHVQTPRGDIRANLTQSPKHHKNESNRDGGRGGVIQVVLSDDLSHVLRSAGFTLATVARSSHEQRTFPTLGPLLKTGERFSNQHV